ncbi:MAG: DUF6448 family protein [Armatimonadota bacterium]
MRRTLTFLGLAALVSAAVLLWLLPARPAAAHCDTMDGPVVAAARSALDTVRLDPVLKWIKPDCEEETKAAFDEALRVRKLGPEARDLADRYFFETVVRLHRAGEGEPFTGLKPAGSQMSPAIAAADKALETGIPDHLVHLITLKLDEGIRHRFTRALEAKKHANDNVEAGREYVEAYVEYMHYAERLYDDAAGGPTHTQDAEAEASAAHEH